ncbi:hypothetical protein TUBRATIS_16610 [Tubulinosema ratisbonensis]|uniref:Uncharacterized protein n=1 Tax=Tubulinosema ratisbonensis TaxID=291195 RepID=A0A437AL84_9MICR|nr:hypothetical protein TUBRATIS_16610 [Tubulinosema ratisbonensis]
MFWFVFFICFGYKCTVINEVDTNFLTDLLENYFSEANNATNSEVSVMDSQIFFNLYQGNKTQHNGLVVTNNSITGFDSFGKTNNSNKKLRTETVREEEYQTINEEFLQNTGNCVDNSLSQHYSENNLLNCVYEDKTAKQNNSLTMTGLNSVVALLTNSASNIKYEHFKKKESEFKTKFIIKLKKLSFQKMENLNAIFKIDKEYFDYTKNKCFYNEEWKLRAQTYFHNIDDYFFGICTVEKVKKYAQFSNSKEAKENFLCFLNYFEFEDLYLKPSNSCFDYVSSNRDFVNFFIYLVKTVNLRSFSLYPRKDILKLMSLKFYIFIEAFLPEYFYLKEILKKKISNDNLDFHVLYFLIRFFLYKGMVSYKKILFIYSLHKYSEFNSFSFFYNPIFANEMFQLRSLLIYICNKARLKECSKILNIINRLHLRYLYSNDLSFTQEKQFWLVYGTLLVYCSFDSFEEWKQKTITNFNKYLQNDRIEWFQNENGMYSYDRFATDLKYLSDCEIYQYRLEMINNLKKKGVLIGSERHKNVIDVIKNLINLRIQAPLVLSLSS